MQKQTQKKNNSKAKLIGITSAIAVAVCSAAFVPAIVVLAKRNNKTDSADIDPVYKEAVTNTNGLTAYPIKLSSPMVESNQLTAAVSNVEKSKGYDVVVDGISSFPGQSIAYALVEMKPVSGHTPAKDEKVSFNLTVTCSEREINKDLWSSEIKDVSAKWGDTANDVDADHDGLTENIDLDDNDNTYKGNINMMGVTMDFNFQMDYKNIFDAAFGDESVKNKWNDNLAKLGSLLSAHIYSPNRVVPEDCNMVYDYKQDDGFYKQLGCKGYEQFHIKSLDGKDVNDITCAEVAYREVKDSTITGDDNTYKVIFLAIQGTANNQEWMSNFDVGAYAADHPEYNYLASGETISDVHPEWHNYANVKGTDVAATRLWTYLFTGDTSWAARNGISLTNDNIVLFTCGHSRGAGIANVLGARFVDEVITPSHNNKIGNITYCYASPFTTDKMEGMTDHYNSIHCVVTGDDFVGKVPFEKWNLQKYGQIHTIEIGQNEANLDKYNEAWKARDPQAKGYVAYDFWTDNVEKMPVHDRYELYQCVDESTTYSSVARTKAEVEATIESNKKVFDDLGVHARYVDQQAVEKTVGSDQWYLQTKIAGGATVDIVNNFFGEKPVDLKKVIAIVPLLESYFGYVVPLALNIGVEMIQGKNIMDVFNCNHSMVSYYFAAANMPAEQK